MKIDQITIYQIRMPYVTPFQTSRWEETGHECILVYIQAHGLEAWGECAATPQCAYSYETTTTNWHILSDFIIPDVFSCNPDTIEDYRNSVAHINGHPMAKAGMEMALWDLYGKRDGFSLQKMIGGEGDRVKVGVSVGIQPTPGELLEVVEGYLEQGYQRIKLKIKPGKDISETAVVRAAHPDLQLQADANSAYTLEDANHLRLLDAFNLLLIEQPLGNDDLLDHSKLQRILQTPVCLDESIHSLNHARWALELNACQIINIKPARVSGLFEARLIHDYCLSHQVPVWMGGMLETGIGRAANVAVASLSGFTLPGDISASARYYAEDIIEEPFVLNPGSTLTVPTGPGLGVAVNSEALKQVTLTQKVYKNPNL